MNNEKIVQNFREYISKYVKNDRISHAYMVESNYVDKISLAKELVKKIIKEDNVTIDDMIKNDDLLILSSDSNTILVKEIEKLKEKFKTKSIYDKKRIYIIDGAEKLNESSSNKLLKFLEEPEENIIAILLTNNKNKVINTIISRCQALRFMLNENKFETMENEYIESMFDFVMNIEENKEGAIAFSNRMNLKNMNDRKYCLDFLNNLLYIYDDALSYKISKKANYFENNIDRLETIGLQNNTKDIMKKINAINSCIYRLKFNPNIRLLLDKLIILMTGDDNNE